MTKLSAQEEPAAAGDPARVMMQNAEHLSCFIAPLLVYERSERNASKWLTGGTCLLAASTTNRFLVTADHVMQEVKNLRREREIDLLLCGNGCEPIDITDWPTLDHDDFIDIHTLQVPPTFEAGAIAKRFFELNHWPRVRAERGDSSFVVGYPGAHRRGTATAVRLRITPLSDFVTDVGPRKFTMADENAEREVLLNPEGLLLPEHFGGMSGSPAFRMREGQRPEFFGVYSTGSDGLQGTFFLSHADFLLSDGRLDHLKIPPR